MKPSAALAWALASAVGVGVGVGVGASSRVSHGPTAHSSAVRGGAWTHHVDDAPPCGFFAASPTACTFARLGEHERLVDRWGVRAVANVGTPTSAAAGRREVFRPFEDTLAAAAAAPASVTFATSKDELYQLDTVDVDLTLHRVNVHEDDWVGVYCLADPSSPTPDHDYIDWKWVNASTPVGETTKTLRLSFGPMVNMRCAWQFRYFASLPEPGKFVKLGESHLLRFALGNAEPLHVRLSSTTSPTQMRVMWVSSAVTDPHVQFGEHPDTLTHRADAERDTYGAQDMCQAPSTTVCARHFRDPGFIYDAVMKELSPGKDYYYRVGSGNGGMSAVFKFRVPPPAGHHPSGSVMSFFMYADLGEWTSAATGLSPPIRSGTTMQLVARELEREDKNYVAVFHDGDLSYARSMAFQWDQFGALIQPVAARLPYMVSVGNHEYDYTDGGEKDPSGAGAHNGFHPPEGNYGLDSAGECGVPTNKRFHMPSNGNKVFWYSVEMGLTHHTVISSEHDYTPGAPMYKWLENDLRNVDRSLTPWLFLHLHRPVYCSENYESDNRVSDLLQRHVEPLLEKYRVDAVFSGHFHAFERTCPVLKKQCRSKPLANGLVEALAPVHIMVGSAGADVDRTTYGNVSWSEARQQEYGYGRVHVHNASHLQFEFQRNRDGAIADTEWIVSSHKW